MSGAAVALFDSLAENYEQHFAEPHRRAYDDLAWELVSTRLPDRPVPQPTGSATARARPPSHRNRAGAEDGGPG